MVPLNEAAVKQSIYEFKKAHLKTRNRGSLILVLEENIGKLFMCLRYWYSQSIFNGSKQQIFVSQLW